MKVLKHLKKEGHGHDSPSDKHSSSSPSSSSSSHPRTLHPNELFKSWIVGLFWCWLLLTVIVYVILGVCVGFGIHLCISFIYPSLSPSSLYLPAAGAQVRGMNKGKRGIPLSHPHTLTPSSPSPPSDTSKGKEEKGGKEGKEKGGSGGVGGEGRDVWPLKLIDLDDKDQTGVLYFLLRRF